MQSSQFWSLQPTFIGKFWDFPWISVHHFAFCKTKSSHASIIGLKRLSSTYFTLCNDYAMDLRLCLSAEIDGGNGDQMISVYNARRKRRIVSYLEQMTHWAPLRVDGHLQWWHFSPDQSRRKFQHRRSDKSCAFPKYFLHCVDDRIHPLGLALGKTTIRWRHGRTGRNVRDVSWRPWASVLRCCRSHF